MKAFLLCLALASVLVLAGLYIHSLPHSKQGAAIMVVMLVSMVAFVVKLFRT